MAAWAAITDPVASDQTLASDHGLRSAITAYGLRSLPKVCDHCLWPAITDPVASDHCLWPAIAAHGLRSLPRRYAITAHGL